MERDKTREHLAAKWTDLSPFSTAPTPVHVPDLLSEGPVRFLLLSGDLDDGGWGLIGAFWLSIDSGRGGFILSPEALWNGSEMVRSYRGALARGWSEEEIYTYWQSLVGVAGAYMVDPQQHADNLFQVARRVGAV
jgi:hypothetical protein